MSFPSFPIAGVQLDGTEPSRAIDGFLKQRADERWVLLGGHAAQSMDQLWTAWIQATRNELREAMVAGASMPNSFATSLARTTSPKPSHERAFKTARQRPGFSTSQRRGVKQTTSDTFSPWRGLMNRFKRALRRSLSGSVGHSVMTTMSFSIEGAQRLGVDLDGWAEERRAESLVAHVLMADDQSSSHR